MQSKLITMDQAAKLVQPGDLLGIGGMTLYRRPTSFVRALINRYLLTREPGNLTLLAFTAGYECDLLVGAGMVSHVRTCYFGLEIFGLAPMFTNQVNKAEEYARSKSGVILEQEEAVLPAFLKRLRQASGLMEEGLVYYRDAALGSPESKRIQAIREVIIAEQLLRILQSNHAILEFEDLRLQFVKEKDQYKAGNILDIMEGILRDEIARTELSLLAVTRDSRLGFQQECDYVYTPYSLKEKLGVLHETLDKLIPSARLRSAEAPASAALF